MGVHVQAHVGVGHAVLGHADTLQALQSRTTHPTAHRHGLVMGCGSQIWARLPHPSAGCHDRDAASGLCTSGCAASQSQCYFATGTQRTFLLLTLIALHVHACAGCSARLPHRGSVGGSSHSGPDLLQRASSVKQLHAQQPLQPGPHPCLRSCSHIERWSDPREHAEDASSNRCNSLATPTYSDGPFTATSAPGLHRSPSRRQHDVLKLAALAGLGPAATMALAALPRSTSRSRRPRQPLRLPSRRQTITFPHESGAGASANGSSSGGAPHALPSPSILDAAISARSRRGTNERLPPDSITAGGNTGKGSYAATAPSPRCTSPLASPLQRPSLSYLLPSPRQPSRWPSRPNATTASAGAGGGTVYSPMGTSAPTNATVPSFDPLYSPLASPYMPSPPFHPRAGYSGNLSVGGADAATEGSAAPPLRGSFPPLRAWPRSAQQMDRGVTGDLLQARTDGLLEMEDASEPEDEGGRSGLSAMIACNDMEPDLDCLDSCALQLPPRLTGGSLLSDDAAALVESWDEARGASVATGPIARSVALGAPYGTQPGRRTPQQLTTCKVLAPVSNAPATIRRSSLGTPKVAAAAAPAALAAPAAAASVTRGAGLAPSPSAAMSDEDGLVAAGRWSYATAAPLPMAETPTLLSPHSQLPRKSLSMPLGRLEPTPRPPSAASGAALLPSRPSTLSSTLLPQQGGPLRSSMSMLRRAKERGILEEPPLYSAFAWPDTWPETEEAQVMSQG